MAEFFSRNNIKIHRILIWLVIIGACIPLVVAACYAVYAIDDFHNVSSLSRGFSLRQGLSETVWGWKNWQGTWFNTFVTIVFSPLLFGGLRALRLYLASAIILAVAGFIFFARTILYYFDIDVKYTVYFTAIMLLPIISYRDYYEIYAWWTGVCGYLIPMIILEIGFAFMLIAKKQSKLWMMIMASLLLFLMSGGVLTNAGYGCFAVFTILAASWFRNKKPDMYFLIPFVSAVIGALLNAGAPGNFKRQVLENTNQNGPIKSAYYSVMISLEEIEILCRGTTFLAFLVAAMLLGMQIRSRTKMHITTNNLIFIAISSIGSVIVANFPMVLGYGATSAKSLPNRCTATSDIPIYIGLVFLFIVLGIRLGEHVGGQDTKGFAVKAVSIAAIALVLFGFGEKIKNYDICKITSNLKSGKIQQFSRDWETIYQTIDDATNGDVIVEYDPMDRVEGCSNPKLSSRPDAWINMDIAEYYGVNSVVLKTSEND